MLDFTILAQYLLHNNETFSYIKHALYRLDMMTKMAFENHCPNNTKLFQPTFNYPKIYSLTYFIKYI